MPRSLIDIFCISWICQVLADFYFQYNILVIKISHKFYLLFCKSAMKTRFRQTCEGWLIIADPNPFVAGYESYHFL